MNAAADRKISAGQPPHKPSTEGVPPPKDLRKIKMEKPTAILNGMPPGAFQKQFYFGKSENYCFSLNLLSVDVRVDFTDLLFLRQILIEKRKKRLALIEGKPLFSKVANFNY